jgi:hypothetical protein
VNKRISFGLLLSLVGLSGPAGSDETSANTPLWQKLEPAWQAVEGKLKPLIGEDRNRLLIDLAYASVVSKVCPGATIKADDFQQAFNRFEDAKYRSMRETDQKRYEHELLIHYGTCIGLLTAEGLADRDTFCSTATKVKLAGGGPYWEMNVRAQPDPAATRTPAKDDKAGRSTR